MMVDTGVLVEVALERKRQNKKWGGPEHDDQHDLLYFIGLIRGYVAWTGTMALMGSWFKARKRLIQVAALAVATVEWIDRRDK